MDGSGRGCWGFARRGIDSLLGSRMRGLRRGGGGRSRTGTWLGGRRLSNLLLLCGLG